MDGGVGLAASRVFRSHDDPDFVTDHHQIADEGVTKAGAAQWSSDESKEASRQQGWVQGDTYVSNTVGKS